MEIVSFSLILEKQLIHEILLAVSYEGKNRMGCVNICVSSACHNAQVIGLP